ncbi:hypothetical protein YA0599_08635 [Pseudomonas syringae]|uniref:hypothetical protein n=1 Tax=Pseudomonas syringae group TaxID=136849 RepID=UPI0005A4C2A9|nr:MULTISPECIES: hypothetical protein [Pseudomonas syringae group]KGS15490.1 hypothetical protein OA77_05515 [Pseudomonas coronafaciens]MBI6708289.1 hypothetical protein [Pseudomonas syringae]RMU88414.1 hypothetical protein ALP20_02983 [Pseudomonas coronafaciens pv. coronafaciens]
MKSMIWVDLLPTNDTIAKMNADELDAVIRATDDYMHTLAHGVSGIGNLLACAADNENSGLSPEAVVKVGWMLESLGGLIGTLSDASCNATVEVCNRTLEASKAMRKAGAK